MVTDQLTPVDYLPLSTPKESSSRQFIRYQNGDSDGSNEVLDELRYDSDRNVPPMPTNDCTFHIDSRAGFETRANTHKLPLINMVINSLGSKCFHTKAK